MNHDRICSNRKNLSQGSYYLLNAVHDNGSIKGLKPMKQIQYSQT